MSFRFRQPVFRGLTLAMVAACSLLNAPTARGDDHVGPAASPPGAIESRALGRVPAPMSVSKQAREGPAGSAGTVRTVGSLAIVLAVIGGAATIVRTAARRRGGLAATLGAGGRAPGGLLEVLGRYPVGRGQSLVLLKMDTRVLLLSQAAGGRFGGGGFSTLCEVVDPEDVASILIKARDADGESMSGRFTSLLRQFDRAHEPADGAAPDIVRRQPMARPRPVDEVQPVVERGAVASLRRRLAMMADGAGGTR